MQTTYTNLSLRQLYAELTKEHELFLKSLVQHHPRKFTIQVSDKVNDLLNAIDTKLKSLRTFRRPDSINLRSKEAFLKVQV